MPQPDETTLEARMREVSRDLNQFRERRLSDRRFNVRDTADRRVSSRLPDTVRAVQQALLDRENG